MPNSPNNALESCYEGVLVPGKLRVLTNPPQVRMCGGTGSRSVTYRMSIAQQHEGLMSYLCLTIVGCWHRHLPQKGPASEGAVRVELLGAWETE